MRSSLVRVARNIPDIVEVLFGKAPSTVGKPIVEVIAERLSKDNALLIYDTSPLLKETMMSVLLQVANSPEIDSQTIESRVKNFKLEKKDTA
ncbi:MAG: hypothetical protein ACKVQW_06180 [Pyrinomonadaceae bacterium]